jgi:signal transduction histidine kinase
VADAVYSNVGRVARGVLLLRLAAIALSVPALASGRAEEGLAFLALLGVLAGSLFPLLAWRRFERVVVRHPIFLGVDLALAVTFLAVAGVDAPFVIATLGTATLGGLLYGVPGGVLCAILLGVGYALAGALTPATGPSPPEASPFLIVVVALYPLLAAAGIALRRLLDNLDAAQRRAAVAVAELSATQERARLARDLHDSVGKTLHGISLMAHALRASAVDEVAAARAAAIEEGARTAAAEARALIADLRLVGDGGTLSDEVLAAATAWGRSHGVTVEVDATGDLDLPAASRTELLAVLGEALENVARHARAQRVDVALHRRDGHVLLEVRDDGRGCPPEALRRVGHWGVVGMRERAARCDGSLAIESEVGAGTIVRLRVPVPDGEVREAADGGTRNGQAASRSAATALTAESESPGAPLPQRPANLGGAR